MSKTSTNQRFRRQRERLWYQNPHCHWCGVETVLQYQSGGKFLLNAATIDHLRPRHHPDRQEPVMSNEVRRVLACWKCNNDRDHIQRQALPKEWFYQRGCGRPLSSKPLKELKEIESFLLNFIPKKSRDRRRIQLRLVDVQNAIREREAQEIGGTLQI